MLNIQNLILGNYEILYLKKLGNIRKILNLGGDMSSAQFFFKKLNFGNGIRKTCKSRYQTLPVLSNFTEILYFF